VATLPADSPRLSALAPDDLRAAILERIERYPIGGHPDAIVERALAYPFEPPLHSYVLVGRHALPLVAQSGKLLLDDEPVAIEEACEALGVRAERPSALHAVLAYGSNGSPQALLRKFARTDEEAGRLVLPVLQGRLDDFDVVYSSHLSAYGSVPATIHPAPGSAVQTYVTMLTDAQVVRLMETEFNYEVRHLEGIRFEGAHLSRTDLIGFVSRHGTLGIEGEPIPLKAIRRHAGNEDAALSEPDVLERVRAYLRPDEDLRDFILRNVGDPRRAVAHTDELKKRRIHFDYAQSTILDA
jgi:hypothetical protein